MIQGTRKSRTYIVNCLAVLCGDNGAEDSRCHQCDWENRSEAHFGLTFIALGVCDEGGKKMLK